MIFFLASAFALDCSTFTGPSCAAVNQMADMIENQFGTRIIADNAPVARLRTATLYHRFEALRAELAAAGCDAPAFLDAGIYDAPGFGAGTFEGVGANPFIENPVSVAIDREARTFTGTWTEVQTTASGVYGNFYASFNGYGKVLTQYDVETLYVAGFWIRTNGNNGVFVNFEGGACPTSAESDLDAWYVTP